MMKKIQILLVSLSLMVLVISCNDGNQKVPPYKKTSAKTIEIAKVPSRIIVLEDRIPVEIEKDDNGRIISRKQWKYDLKGFPKNYGVFLYSFDEKGNRVGEKVESYGLDGALESAIENRFVYNDKNQQTDYYYTSFDRDMKEIVAYHTVMTYNEIGKEASSETYTSDEIPISKTFRIYDDEGLISNETFKTYDKSGSLVDDKTLHYDEFGTVIKEN